MRDYSQPHPDAIFKDKPTSFIEVWRNKTNTYVGVDFYIGSLERVLHNTIKHGHKTIALFIIKPKKP